MKSKQLLEVFEYLSKNKRLKFQNNAGWGSQTMAINAILEQGNCYIFIWACHPALIKEDLKEDQKLIWYNPNCGNAHLITKYFPEY